jgi:hypothetical protein
VSHEQPTEGTIPPRRSRSRVLAEYRRVRQIKGESFRRWFNSRDLDLIVWFDPRGRISGFQLCYDQGSDQRALTWFRDKGYAHNRVDDGEDRPGGIKMTPILVADGVFERDRIVELFTAESAEIDPAVVELVGRKLREYPGPRG